MDPVNPYQAYNHVPNQLPDAAPGLRRSILSQIRVISILLIVHGVMLTLMGFFLIGMAVVMPTFIAAHNQQLKQPSGPPPEQLQTILLATYGLMGAAGLIPGILQIVAGVNNLRLRGRVLGIVALLGGMVAVGTCYCAPTAIALAIYGLVIYFNDTAQKAFALGAEGRTMAEVEQMAN